MKALLELCGLFRQNFSLYQMAEGEEEYRVKREILSNIQQRGSRAAFIDIDECGPLRDTYKDNAQENQHG